MVIRLAYIVESDFKQGFDLLGVLFVNDFDDEVVTTTLPEYCLG